MPRRSVPAAAPCCASPMLPPLCYPHTPVFQDLVRDDNAEHASLLLDFPPGTSCRYKMNRDDYYFEASGLHPLCFPRSPVPPLPPRYLPAAPPSLLQLWSSLFVPAPRRPALCRACCVLSPTSLLRPQPPAVPHSGLRVAACGAHIQVRSGQRAAGRGTPHSPALATRRLAGAGAVRREACFHVKPACSVAPRCRLYMDARGEVDLREPGESSLGFTVHRPPPRDHRATAARLAALQARCGAVRRRAAVRRPPAVASCSASSISIGQQLRLASISKSPTPHLPPCRRQELEAALAAAEAADALATATQLAHQLVLNATQQQQVTPRRRSSGWGAARAVATVPTCMFVGLPRRHV